MSFLRVVQDEPKKLTVRKNLALASRELIDTFRELGLESEMKSFLEEVFKIIVDDRQSFGGKIFRFQRATIAWDENTADDCDKIRTALRKYLIQSTTESMKFYDTEEAASIAFEVFDRLWLGRISERAIKTLYNGLAGGVSVSAPYLQAIEAIPASGTPLPPQHRPDTIYFKHVGEPGSDVMARVNATSRRPEIIHWSDKALARPEPLPAAVLSIKNLWDGTPPFEMSDMRPYQIGRKLGPLKNRQTLEALALADTRYPAGQRSRWHESVGCSTLPTQYFPFIQQGQRDGDERKAKLELVSSVELVLRLT